MRSLLSCALLGTLLASGISHGADNIQRCDDGAGQITFTSMGCPATHASQQVEAFNAPPGSVSPPALPERNANPARTAPQEIVVVGQRDDGCGNRLSAEQRRLAIINQRTPPGMTQRDVESLLGRPDRTTQRNGELRYYYTLKNGRSNQVVFDPEGCVKGKR